MDWPTASWPTSAPALIAAQRHLAIDAAAALAAGPWRPAADLRVGGSFVAFAPDAGHGGPAEGGWAAAVVWRPGTTPRRRADAFLRGPSPAGPRRATDVDDQAVVAGRAFAAYIPGLLALRDGPMLAEAIRALRRLPDVLLVDATGLDHPRGAGLAVHLGAVCDVPTVGVTRRPLVARGEPPPLVRGASTPVRLDRRAVGRWVCTRTGVRPLVAHAAWPTDPETAATVVVAASTEGARTPVPLQEARRVAREARALERGDASEAEW